jgi:hypothetical protein
MREDLRPSSKTVLGAAMVFLGMQSAMTFSRGGLYTAGIAIFLSVAFLLRNARATLQLILVGGFVFLAANYLVLPQLDEFTGGMLSARFESTDPTGRGDLIMSDLRLWAREPIYGVGPGVAKYLRAETGYFFSAAHTEETRLLSEHGSFGLCALLLLLVMAWKSVANATTRSNRFTVVAFVSWSLLYMLNAAMRLFAPGLLFGLAFAVARARQPSDNPNP